MGAKLTFKYDRDADILYVNKCLPTAPRNPKSLVIARLNPQTGEVENLKVPGGEISPQRHREHRADTAGPAPGRGATQLETYVPFCPGQTVPERAFHGVCGAL